MTNIREMCLEVRLYPGAVDEWRGAMVERTPVRMKFNVDGEGTVLEMDALVVSIEVSEGDGLLRAHLVQLGLAWPPMKVPF
jgi:hypothetical protein